VNTTLVVRFTAVLSCGLDNKLMEKVLFKIATFGLTAGVTLLFFTPRLIWMRGTLYWLFILPLLFLPKRYLALFKHPGMWLYGLLAGFGLASTLWGDAASADAFRDGCKDVVQVGLFLLAMWTLALYQDYRRLLAWTFVLAAAPSVLYAIYNYYSVHPWPSRMWGWTRYDFPTEVGAQCGMAALSGVMLMFLQKRRLIQVLLGVAVLILICGMIASQARASLFAFALAVSLMSLHFRGGRIIALLLTGASLIVFVLLATHVIEFRNLTFSARWNLWQHLISSTTNPWIGVGINTDVRYEVFGLWHYHAHNIFVNAYYKTGLIGLVLLIALVAGGIKFGISHYRANPTILNLYPLCWFVASIITCLTDHADLIWRPTMVWFLIWMPYGMLLVDWNTVRPLKQTAAQ